MATQAHRARLLSLYDIFPFHQHPMWTAVKRKELSIDQVLDAETQHWIRTRSGQKLRREALNSARGTSSAIFRMLLKTYLEECTSDKSGPSHLQLIERLLLIGGLTQEQIEGTVPTPGNSAAISLYRDIGARGAGCHMLGAGAVEHYYSELCQDIFEVYTDHYEMSDDQAETYRIHGPMDADHADRAFAVLDEAIDLHGWQLVELSVRDAFVATSLHYDGMLQAATGSLSYWDGVTA